MSFLTQLSHDDREHFRGVCAAFFNYQVDSMLDLIRLERDLRSSDLSSKAENLKSAVYANYAFLSRCVHGSRALFPCKTLPNGSYMVPNLRVNQREIRQIRAVLKLCAKEWSEEGADERGEIYGTVIEEVKRNFPRSRLSNGAKVKILTPGASLGRLSFEFARLGYSSQGTESSFFHLLVSDFLLNKTKRRHEHCLCPYLHNYTSSTALLQANVPDLCPAEELSLQDDLSMVAGDFGKEYSSHGSEWDCVVTCFGSNSDKNVMQYVETIWKIVKLGGMWVHFSPARCRITDKSSNTSIDVAYTDTRQAMLAKGFQLVKEEMRSNQCTQEKWVLQVACKRNANGKKS